MKDYNFEQNITIVGKIPGKIFGGMPIYFSQITKFEEIFCSSEAYNYNDCRPNGFVSIESGEKGYRSYATVKGYSTKFHPLKLTARPFLNTLIRDMFLINTEELYFSLNVREDGKTLVSINYGQILGGKWIALIDTDSLPDEINNTWSQNV